MVIPRNLLGTQMKQDVCGCETNNEAVDVQRTRIRHTVNLTSQIHTCRPTTAITIHEILPDNNYMVHKLTTVYTVTQKLHHLHIYYL